MLQKTKQKKRKIDKEKAKKKLNFLRKIQLGTACRFDYNC
jgi:hypothetical protein